MQINNFKTPRPEIEKELRSRAHKDEAFRLELQANPRAVLERDYPHWLPEGKVPAGLSINIIDEQEQTLNVVLLPQSSNSFSTLVGEELDSVSGGVSFGGLNNGVRGLSGIRDEMAGAAKSRERSTSSNCGDRDTVTDSCCSRRMGR
jgi:hypothetical protein